MKYLILVCLFVSSGFPSSAETIDFEHGLDFPGIAFNDLGIVAEYPGWPAHSGTHVAFVGCCDYPPTITFDQPINTFSGYFNYVSTITQVGLSITAYGINDQPIVTVDSRYSSNVCSYCGYGVYDPNELLTLSSVVPIKWLLFGYDLEFGFFSMDDISFTATPEPSSLALTVAALCISGLMWFKACIR